MADRPILFSAPMVRALIDGRKTQTRRLLKPQPTGVKSFTYYGGSIWGITPETIGRDMAYNTPVIQAGDRLWVREEFSGPYQFKPKVNPPTTWPVGCDIWYWADGNPDYGDWTKPKRSMHMPRWMSRLTLIVTDVRVDRLQDISEADAIAEGIFQLERKAWIGGGPLYGLHEGVGHDTAVGAYNRLWRDINGDGSWAPNPWVVAYSFRVIKQNIDQIEKVAA